VGVKTRPEAMSAEAAAQARIPTFNRDVAPILFNYCVACHRPNGVGPMSLLTFDSARAHAERIRQKVGRARCRHGTRIANTASSRMHAR
jgi:hypothetical protein